MRIRVLTTTAVLAVVVVFWMLMWPAAPIPARGSPDQNLQRRTLAGAVHVHSTQSDGAGTRTSIAAAAARAGLRFVIFTDHGDGTREPAPAEYLNGVLCLDAVEISTNGGHYVALGLAKAPYRLGGEAAAVAEDVRRLGGFGIVAHPDSPKPQLAWKDWRVETDGVEWLNADSAWRSRSSPSLVRTLLGYLARPAPALAGLLDRPEATISRWDESTFRRQVPAIAGHDAHGGVGASPEEGRRFGLPGVPSYEASFRAFSTRAVLVAQPTGTAAGDAALLLEAIRKGRTYTVIDGAVAGAWLELRAEREGHEASMGESLAGSGPAKLTVRAPIVDGGSLVLLRNGSVISETRGGEVSTLTSSPGAYRVEGRLGDGQTRAPWIFSNPIYIDIQPAVPPQSSAPPTEIASLGDAQWRTERDPSSTAVLDSEAGLAGMAFRIGSGESAFAALVAPLPRPVAPFDAVVVDIESGLPARISLQFRSSDGLARWGKSIYLSPSPGPIVVKTDDLVAAEKDSRAFDPGTAESVLLVVDLVNSTHGSSGRFHIRHLGLARSR